MDLRQRGILKMEANSFLLEGQQGNFCCTGFFGIAGLMFLREGTNATKVEFVLVIIN